MCFVLPSFTSFCILKGHLVGEFNLNNFSENFQQMVVEKIMIVIFKKNFSASFSDILYYPTVLNY